MKDRRFDIDNLKGILIFLVVFGHLLFPVSLKNDGFCYFSDSFIYFFHMPFFLFLSGIVSKKINFKEYISKILLIYFTFNFSYALFDFYLNGKQIDFIHPYYSMWFLIVLLVGRILISLTDKTFICLLISFIFSLFSGFSPIDNTFAFSRILGFMPFFLFGYFLQEKGFFDFKDKNNKKKFYLIVPFIMVLYIIYEFVINTNLSIVNFYVFNRFSNNIEFFYRLFLILIDSLLILVSLFIVPNRKIPFITNLGQNSLYVFLFHRFITLLLEKIFIPDKERLIISFFVAIIICLLFGNNLFKKCFNIFFKFLNKKKFYVYFFLGLFVITNEFYLFVPEKENKMEILDVSDTIKISYIGDMLLFKDDIYKANNIEEYDFSKYFDGTNEYFGDFTIGNFEGVISKKELVNSNYADKTELKLLYPEKFVDEIAKNIDFVTICNNHMFDGGYDNFEYTKEYLNKNNIQYTDGSDIKIIDIKGCKFAILSYTYGTNFSGKFDNRQYLNDSSIYRDFNRLKDFEFDKIIVLVHSGTEFSNNIDYSQDYYSKLLNYLGADIVYFDHSHNVEPIKYINNTIVFYGAGNFSSSYSGNNCDKGAIYNLYLSKNDFNILAAGVIPIKSVVSENNITYPVSTYNLGDIDSSNYVFENVLGKQYPCVIEELLYSKEYGVALKDFENKIDSSGLINGNTLFIGDSITYGYFLGVPYYNYIKFDDSVNILTNISKNGWTSDDLLKKIEDLNKEDLNEYDNFFIAIGINDIRYFGKNNKLLENLDKIISLLPKNKNIYIVNPWLVLDGDLLHNINIDEQNSVIKDIRIDLINFCEKNQLMFLDLNPYIEKNIKKSSKDMIDFVHPNINGIKIYSEALIDCLEKEF